MAEAGTVRRNSSETRDRVRELRDHGYTIVADTLPAQFVRYLEERADEIYAATSKAPGIAPMHLLGFIDRDARFLELIDWPDTLAIVRSVLGDNIYVYHNHVDVRPPLRDGSRTYNWHQDLHTISADIPELPRPISIKVGFFLSDVPSREYGAMLVQPGTHRGGGVEDLDGGVPVLLSAGSAVLFEHRLWHSPSSNTSSQVRKSMFVAYAYRWMRRRDNPPAFSPEAVSSMSAVRRQLLDVIPPDAQLTPEQMSDGIVDFGRGDGERYYDPKDVDVPLRSEPLPGA